MPPLIKYESRKADGNLQIWVHSGAILLTGEVPLWDKESLGGYAGKYTKYLSWGEKKNRPTILSGLFLTQMNLETRMRIYDVCGAYAYFHDSIWVLLNYFLLREKLWSSSEKLNALTLLFRKKKKKSKIFGISRKTLSTLNLLKINSS